ncbi:MAG TPA: hypothetical protein VMB50_05315 [Myxococcales bacterium]|jgi:hypothetical protein|nr:hypothetical protein [Myxococcales bacterium]
MPRLTLVWLCLALAGCFSDRSPSDVERRFLDKYYLEVDQAAALALSVGPARNRIQDEIADLAEARREGLESAPAHPRMSYRKLSDRPPPAPGQREVEYRLSIDSSGVRFDKLVDLVLEQDAGRWRVRNFAETDMAHAE